jgi:hypothetical protein
MVSRAHLLVGGTMHLARTLPALIAVVALPISCGNDDASRSDTTTTTIDAATTIATATTAAAETTTEVSATTTEVVALAQPAIWPAAEVVFATPEEAAADFVQTVLGVPPVLGAYRAGDARSGEIEVFSPGELTPASRGLLLLRQLGPNDGWFVIGAANPDATISTPDTYAEVAAGALTVEGVARGYETTVVVTAFLAGDDDAVVDEVVTAGGAFETPEPYSVTIDLTTASPGDVVALLVRGDTGLETDPGVFGAILVVIAD